MAEDKTINLIIKTNINDVSKNVDTLKKGLHDVKTETDGVAESTTKVSKVGDVFNQLKQGAESLIPGLKGAQGAASGLATQFMALLANPIGLMITAVVVSLKFLYEAFQSSIAGGKELKAIWAALEGVGAQIKDAVFGLGRAFISTAAAAYKFITLDFKGAAEAMKNANKEASTSFKQLGDAVDGTTGKILYSLAKQQQAVDKARKNQAVVQSETNKLLVKSREILTDETASINEKKKALAEVTKAEKASSAERVRIAKEDLKIAQARAKALGGEAEKKSKQELRDLQIALNEAETDNATTGIKLNKQRKMLNRQEAADAKAAADERKASQKAATDAAKAAAKEKYDAEKLKIDEIVKDEKKSFEERRKAVNDDALLTKADKAKYLKQINDEESKKIEEHKKAIADLENKYKIETENAAAQTEEQKINLKNQRNIDEINKLAQTEAEKKSLLLLAEEQYQRELNALKDKNRQDSLLKEATKDLEDANNSKLSFEARLQAVADREALEKNIVFKNQEERTAFEKANADARVKIGDEEQKAKEAQLSAVGTALQGLSEIAGKETAAGKALATSAALINVYKGISEVWAAKSMGNPIVDMAVKIASTAIVAAQGFANIKKIMAVKVPGSSGGGAAGGGGAMSAPVAAAPQFNVVGTSGQNQIAQSIGNQQPVKAYVVANDVSTQQSLDRNIVKTATIGN